jgi:hypothetical protein
MAQTATVRTLHTLLHMLREQKQGWRLPVLELSYWG